MAYARAAALEGRAVRRLGMMRLHLADERLAHGGGEEVRHDEHVPVRVRVRVRVGVRVSGER